MANTKTSPPSATPPDAPRMPSGVTKDGWLRVATVGRPHGIAGELRVWLDNPDSELLWRSFEDPKATPLRLTTPNRAPVSTHLVGLRAGGDALLARFAGLDGREAAAKLTHAAVEVPRSVLPPAENGEFYHVDVIGAGVYDEASGEHVGKVTAITTTSVDVLVIALDAGGELMLPIIEAYVPSIGEVPGRVVVRDLDHWT